MKTSNARAIKARYQRVWAPIFFSGQAKFSRNILKDYSIPFGNAGKVGKLRPPELAPDRKHHTRQER
jgi:hypothetical protein